MKLQLSKPQFLYLTTHGWKSGKEHRIEIWFVEHNKRYYIIYLSGSIVHIGFTTLGIMRSFGLRETITY
jgi:hypothetical protein